MLLRNKFFSGSAIALVVTAAIAFTFRPSQPPILDRPDYYGQFFSVLIMVEGLAMIWAFMTHGYDDDQRRDFVRMKALEIVEDRIRRIHAGAVPSQDAVNNMMREAEEEASRLWIAHAESRRI